MLAIVGELANDVSDAPTVLDCSPCASLGVPKAHVDRNPAHQSRCEPSGGNAKGEANPFPDCLIFVRARRDRASDAEKLGGEGSRPRPATCPHARMILTHVNAGGPTVTHYRTWSERASDTDHNVCGRCLFACSGGTRVDLTLLIEVIGEKVAMALVGLCVGLVFGISAQRSQFCLRAATIEFWRGATGHQPFWGGVLGPRTATWLLVFGTALAGTQILLAIGYLEPSRIRQLSTTGTLSGALFGGLMFGAGMILARGCASRLLVLSATGNLRALVSGLILTVTAQAALTGILSTARLRISALWTIPAEMRDLHGFLPAGTGLLLGFLVVGLAVALGMRHRIPLWRVVAAAGVGCAVVLGWGLTAAIAARAFEVVSVESVTFTGPSTDTLMVLIARPDMPLSFGIGLVPGVFAGSFFAALLSGEFAIQTFSDATPLPRYIAGAMLMGFGSMLAGGCAVGAGVTGGALMASTAWLALLAMWVAAGIVDYVIDRPRTGTVSDARPSNAVPGAEGAI